MSTISPFRNPEGAPRYTGLFGPPGKPQGARGPGTNTLGPSPASTVPPFAATFLDVTGNKSDAANYSPATASVQAHVFHHGEAPIVHHGGSVVWFVGEKRAGPEDLSFYKGHSAESRTRLLFANGIVVNEENLQRIMKSLRNAFPLHSDVRVVPGKNDVAVAIAVADTTKVVLPDHAGPGYNAIGHGADEWNSARICGSRRKDIPVSSLVYAALVATPDGAGNVRLQTVLYADPPAHSMPDNILAVVYLGIMKLVLQKEDAHAELVAAPQLSFKRF